MKIILVAAMLASTLSSCVVVPVGPPGAYYGPRVVVPAPVVIVRPWHYRRGNGY